MDTNGTIHKYHKIKERFEYRQLLLRYIKIRDKYCARPEWLNRILTRGTLNDIVNMDTDANWKTINGTPVLIDDNGNVMAGPAGIKNWASKEKTKYAPSPQRQKKGIQVSKKKYARLTGTLNTQYPGLKPEDGYRTIRDADNWYSVTADGYGGMIIHSKAKIE